ncbi:Large subunit of N,N-dimethylformamidase [Mycolicibacterium aurum]|uniref:Large subunit of N,N-dimethylformamidase n=1 Tax=Mycolicibacterium aurum TaxID=1791 RepID=A0A448IJT1_MYCAU|nr:N,N-dimethylformamidase beta subunit family domain-containing protein [Mycolicibacterium aurum]VEG52658.1 Large subunit of N,N-dimethylformamidase [Mycolicibacterium aurum]
MKTSLRLRGYNSQPNVAPGESLTFHLAHGGDSPVDTRLLRMYNGNLNPDGPGHRTVHIPSDLDRRIQVDEQFTQSGGYVRVPDPERMLLGSDSFSVHLYVWATLPALGRQGVISRWDDTTSTGWAVALEPDGLVVTLGDGDGNVVRVRTGMPLYKQVWYSVVITVDATAVTVSQRAVITSTNSIFGLVVPFDGDTEVSGPSLSPGDSGTALLLSGLGLRSEAPPHHRMVAGFNGKIESPRYWSRTLSQSEISACHDGQELSDTGLVAAWQLNRDSSVPGPGLGDQVDEPVNGLVGECVNQPDRGMTGWRWTAREFSFAHAIDEYGAIWFHNDSLDDCRWPATLSYTVPQDLPSGCYALACTEAEGHDPETFYVPFFVTAPRGTATGSILLLIPTFSYQAYANSQVYQNASAGQLANGHITVLEDLDFAMSTGVEQYGLSLYDRHLDGGGVQYSTWRRPQLNMQPSYQHEQSSQVWQYPADLHLVCWMTDQGFDYDVATDHDLHQEGVELLQRYNVVLTATHPEYYSEEMIDAWERYLVGGGRGMYMGGNGMYWVTSVAPDKSHVVEVRRGEVGDQPWRGRPGELQHSTTGEKGSLWRMRGRAPQRVWGTGYTAHTMAVSTYYEFLPDAADPGVGWITDGVDTSCRLGDFGLVNGGAAGLEVDRYDLDQGSPPHTRVLATSVDHDANSMLVTEEIYGAHPATNGEESPLVRADITYFTTPNGGAMFATSSMSWCASLFQADGNNAIGKITANVIQRFSDPTPIDELV